MLPHTTRPPVTSELRNGALVVTDNRTPADRPTYAYNNGQLFQDGHPATADETQAFNRTNPYVPQNWLATPEDRGGRIPGTMPDVPSLAPQPTALSQTVDPSLTQQLVAMSHQQNIPLDDLLERIGPILLGQTTTASPLSAPLHTTDIRDSALSSQPSALSPRTPVLRNLLPGLSSKYGRARQA